MAIKITTSPTARDLTGKSHWWGFPDLPAHTPYPCAEPTAEGEPEETLTFICQIDLRDIAHLDAQQLLPHNGMLYFFAHLDYFLGDLDAPCMGLGTWPLNAFKVIYSPTTDNLHTHEIYYDDNTPATLPAEEMTFAPCPDGSDGCTLLGSPLYDEVTEENPGLLSLLQVDENDRWGLRFFDCGTLNFLIEKSRLLNKDFDSTSLYCHSF